MERYIVVPMKESIIRAISYYYQIRNEINAKENFEENINDELFVLDDNLPNP